MREDPKITCYAAVRKRKGNTKRELQTSGFAIRDNARAQLRRLLIPEANREA